MIRFATLEDVSGILKIENESRLENWSAADYQKEIGRNDSITLVAVSDTKIKGYLTARLVGSITTNVNSATVRFDESDIVNLGVLKTHRNKGIGSKLLKELISQLIKAGVGHIWLEVRESNVNAIEFYAKHGFIRVQIRKNFYKNPTDNAAVMKLDIPTSGYF